MRIIIRHNTPPEGLTFPISYHHILQSVIYAHMKESAYGNLHEDAYVYGKRIYRMFTFSELFGKYKIHDRKITFYGMISFKIASPDKNLLKTLAKNFEMDGIQYGEQICKNVSVEIVEEEIRQTTVAIHMISPICVYSTNEDTGKTCFYDPGTKEFATRLSENFERKYRAYYGTEPTNTPTITPKCVLQKHKKVTNYKGFMLSGWLGDYEIAGTLESLNFWMEAGIGSKNAEGFGMFEVIEKR